MKKILFGLFILGFMTIGSQVFAEYTVLPTITVTSPNNGYEAIESGQKVEIRWESNISINALVDVYVSDGIHTGEVVRTSNNGAYGLIYTLDNSLTPGSNYRAYVSLVSENPVSDSSDYPFTIRPVSVSILPDLVVTDFSWTPEIPIATYTSNVTSLAGYLHMTVTIKNIGNADVVLPENMRVSLYKEGILNGGLSLGTAYYKLKPGDSETFTFSTTAGPNITEKPGIFDLTMIVDDPGLNIAYHPNGLINESNENNNTLIKEITIRSNTIDPSITVISPNGGGSINLAETPGIYVTWKTENIHYDETLDVIRLQRYVNNVKSGEYNLAANVINDGSETVALPRDIPTGYYKIEIKSYVGSTLVFDDNDGGYIYIKGISSDTPSITVISPNGGETYTSGQRITIKWKTNNIKSNPNTQVSIMDDRTPGWQTLSLFGSVPALNYAKLVSTSIDNTENIYEYTFTVPSSFNGSLPLQFQNIYGGNHYKTLVNTLISGVGGTSSQQTVEDLSDNLFTITNNNSCSHGEVYSSTTGQRCLVNTNPVISGISGPQTLNVNQTGTWKIIASSSNGGSLSYTVDWGENIMYTREVNSTSTSPVPQQSATFTHTYTQAGTYTPTFTVTSENTIRCFTIPCSSNEGSATTSLTVNVGNIPIICPQYVYDPNFCINGTIKELIGYNGCPSYSCIAPGDGCLYGNQFSITTGQLCPTTIPTTPIRRTLRRGLTGEDVKVLQTFLTNNGYNCGNADGSFGPITQAKVIEWQAQNGLTADGAFGAMSQAKAGFNQ